MKSITLIVIAFLAFSTLSGCVVTPAPYYSSDYYYSSGYYYPSSYYYPSYYGYNGYYYPSVSLNYYNHYGRYYGHNHYYHRHGWHGGGHGGYRRH